MMFLDHSLSSLHQFSPESPSWSLSSCHGMGSQTMTSVKRLGENALLTWHLGTVAMGLQASLLLQSGGSVPGGGAVEIRDGVGRVPLVPALAPAAPLFSRAPSESKSSPSREGDDLGSSAVPCQKRAPQPLLSPLF